MEQFAQFIIAALLVVGGLFTLVGSWGLARLPSLLTRLHGPTKATTLGVGGALMASMIYFPVYEGRLSAHELLITIFLFLTAPVTANMIAKAYLHTRSREPEAGAIEDRLPETGTGVLWATFQTLDRPAGDDGDPAAQSGRSTPE
jgi:multicomponent K+:H+ antiporter subunit G